MKELITEEQKREIGELGKEHWDALVAFGADMHRQGICKGALVAAAGAGICVAFAVAVELVSKKVLEYIDRKQEES